MRAIFDLRQNLTRAGALICFNGPFSHSIIEELGKAVKHYLETQDLEKGAMMDVFSVYIEATQNVRNYASAHDLAGRGCSGTAEGIIVIGRDGDRYVVSSGNYMLEVDGESLGARLDELNLLDKASLKGLYREQMRRPLPEGATGAGLGLIDMARKASLPLQYSLVPEGDGLTFFSLRVVI
nr:SiaB family protein kinase [uncultured Holophaga sp.]